MAGLAKEFLKSPTNLFDEAAEQRNPSELA